MGFHNLVEFTLIRDLRVTLEVMLILDLSRATAIDKLSVCTSASNSYIRGGQSSKLRQPFSDSVPQTDNFN